MLSTPISQHTVNGQLTTDNLYNGNISTWATNTPALSVKGVADMCNQYTYDQLNRIKSSTVFGKADAYKTGYSYDANGNILTLQRFNGTGQLFDQFSYNYENKVAGYLQNTNKLRSVDDAISNTALHEEDLEDQNTDNYQYDDIGNLSKDTQEEIDKIEWTVYGKVKAVYRKTGSLKPNLVFEYDATGNRVAKTSIKGSDIQKTFYIRDASGNVMSTYTSTGTSSLIALQEQNLYGSSRLGVLEKGSRSYELTDHLGNVRAVVNEFNEVKAAYEYYAFGMSLAKVEGRAYRYGFNGKEKDTEGMGGGGSTYDYGFRIYNPALGKFLSVDPIGKKFPWYSPYQFAGNSPIAAVDLDGLEPHWMFKTEGAYKIVPIIGVIEEPQTRVSPEVATLLVHAFDFDPQLVANTKVYIENWRDDNSTDAQTIFGITFNTNVLIGKHKNDPKEWFNTLAHELQHKQDMEGMGTFYQSSYIGDMIKHWKTYSKDFDLEKKGYATGSLADKLFEFKGSQTATQTMGMNVNDILSSKVLKDNQKRDMLTLLGMEFNINNLKTKIANVEKQISVMKGNVTMNDKQKKMEIQKLESFKIRLNIDLMNKESKLKKEIEKIDEKK